MASSFSAQIPVIINVIQQLRPATVLDVGKGFGKYGFLIHEYVGIDSSRRPDPSKTLSEQSAIAIDAVECNPDYMWPHIRQLYRQTYIGRIEELHSTLPRYDLVLMCDVIEHLDKAAGLKVVQHFIVSGSAVLISSPTDYFNQELFGSADEHHLSHWTAADFRLPTGYCEYQTADAGRVYLVSPHPLDVRGFGNGLLKRARRIARVLRDELC